MDSFNKESQKSFGPTVPSIVQTKRDYGGVQDVSTSSAMKPKGKKRGGDYTPLTLGPNPQELQDATIGNFCEVLDDFCCKAEIPNDDRYEAEWLPLPLADIRTLGSETMSFRARRLLHMVPADLLVRLLRVLDHQIHWAEGSSVDEYDHSDSDVALSVFSSLESIHAALALMAHSDMSKQLHKEEIIEIILEFSRHQIVDVMCAYDPTYRALHKPRENGELEDEALQLLIKLPVSKKALRTYHLPDEEQRQIQMISALLIQLVHCSANIPDALRQASGVNPSLEVTIDAGYPIKSYEAATEACCLFWTLVLLRFAALKTQDASELKVMVENLVMDLLTTLTLPECPASAPLLEIVEVVLCQGLVHPITCVPYLIALETDPQEANAKLGHHLLMNMNEKYPAFFFESRLGYGLQLSFAFMQSVAGGLAENLNNKLQTKIPGNMRGKSYAGSLTQARLGVCRIYKLSFVETGFRGTNLCPPLYCTEILALLPYTFSDEPLCA